MIFTVFLLFRFDKIFKPYKIASSRVLSFLSKGLTHRFILSQKLLLLSAFILRYMKTVKIVWKYQKNHALLYRTPAQVAELVDAHGSGPCGGNTVEVRVLSRAPAHHVMWLYKKPAKLKEAWRVFYWKRHGCRSNHCVRHSHSFSRLRNSDLAIWNKYFHSNVKERKEKFIFFWLKVE